MLLQNCEVVVVEVEGAVVEERADDLDDGVASVAGREGVDCLADVGASGARGVIDDGVAQAGLLCIGAPGLASRAADVTFAARLGRRFAEIAQQCVGAAFRGVEHELLHRVDPLLHAFALTLVDVDGDDDVARLLARGGKDEIGCRSSGDVVDYVHAPECEQGVVDLLGREAQTLGYREFAYVYIVGKQACVLPEHALQHFFGVRVETQRVEVVAFHCHHDA